MFNKNTFRFLIENRLNNSKEWFIEHKSDYENYILNPLVEIAVSLTPTIISIDNEIITSPKIDKTISRIYRDIRFSKDKSLYRDSFWLSFKRDKKDFPNYPEFFFVVTKDYFCYGTGYYATSPEVMNCMRDLIIKEDPMFIKALNAFESQDDFMIEGEMFKKSKHPNSAENLRNWLDCKNISIMCKSVDFSILYKKEIVEQLIKTYKQMEPIYNFFIYNENKSKEISLL